MSVFRVKLHNDKQGLLDIYNNQRTAYITGPNKVNRKLKDGEVFTDCNYWKRFAYPQVPLEEAFIEVIEDDGTIYNENSKSEYSFPKVYDILAKKGSKFVENKADIIKDSGGCALFAQITNKSKTDSIKIKLNGLKNAIIDIDPGNTQVFSKGDLDINLIEIDNSEGEDDALVQIIVSIKCHITS